MAVEDTWIDEKTGERTKRYGRGLRYRSRWRDHGNQRSKSFRTKPEANRHQFDVLTATPVDEVSSMTVDEMTETLLATKKGLAKNTVYMYKNGVRHVLEEFSGTVAASVLPSEIKTWIASMEGSGSLRQQALLALHQSYDLAVADGALLSNPCQGVTVSRGEKRDPIYLDVDELTTLADCAGDYRLMMMWLGTSGPRIGEAAGLKIPSIDFARSRVRLTGTKGKRARDVPILPSLVDDFKKLVKGRSGYVFTSPEGRQLNVRNWNRRQFADAVEASGVTKDLVPHDLRHTAASLAIGAGADVKAVQLMLGHKSAKMTLDIYGHLWDSTLDGVAARVDNLLKPTSETVK